MSNTTYFGDESVYYNQTEADLNEELAASETENSLTNYIK
jgi:hypothetical protein